MPLNELISDLELDGIRADAVQLFVDECVITRPLTPRTFDPDTETSTAGTSDTIYFGECSIYPMAARRDTVDVLGEGMIYVRQYRLITPWTEDDVIIGDQVVITVSADPQIINRDFEVRDVFKATNLGYRRITVHETDQ